MRRPSETLTYLGKPVSGYRSAPGDTEESRLIHGQREFSRDAMAQALETHSDLAFAEEINPTHEIIPLLHTDFLAKNVPLGRAALGFKNEISALPNCEITVPHPDDFPAEIKRAIADAYRAYYGMTLNEAQLPTILHYIAEIGKYQHPQRLIMGIPGPTDTEERRAGFCVICPKTEGFEKLAIANFYKDHISRNGGKR